MSSKFCQAFMTRPYPAFQGSFANKMQIKASSFELPLSTMQSVVWDHQNLDLPFFSTIASMLTSSEDSSSSSTSAEGSSSSSSSSSTSAEGSSSSSSSSSTSAEGSSSSSSVSSRLGKKLCHSFFFGGKRCVTHLLEGKECSICGFSSIFLISYAWNLKSIGELCLFQRSYFNKIRYIFYDKRVFQLFFNLSSLPAIP